MLEIFRRDTGGEGTDIVDLPISKIAPNPNQPRKYFDKISLTELAKSISKHGVLQPITVRVTPDGYELITGERRLRACEIAGFDYIPAIIVDADVGQSAILTLLENLQREDLCFFEVAQSYKNLLKQQGMTQQELANQIGQSQSNIANKMRLLKLAPRVKKLIRDYGLSERHARAILNIMDEDLQIQAVKYIHSKKLSVTEAENYVIDLITQKTHKSSNIKITSLKDMRVFTNTINHAVDMVKKGGIEANVLQKEHDWGVEYIISVKNK